MTVPQGAMLAHVWLLAVALMLWGRPARAEEAALADAVERRMASNVDRLLQEGADVNAPQADGMTALHWAVFYEDEELAEQLLQAGAAADAQSRYGVTPLIVASENGNGRLVKVLLAGGADPNATLQGQESVLMIASRPVDSGQ